MECLQRTMIVMACVALLGACGSSELGTSSGGNGGTGASMTCDPGTERCPCYGNGTCNDGLVCASNLCVVVGGSGGSSGAGGTNSGGDGGVGGTGGAAAATLPEACARLAQVSCEQDVACAPWYVGVGYGTEQDCIRYTTDGCVAFLSAASIENIDACSASWATQDCERWLYERNTPECTSLSARQPDGASCSTLSDCESGRCDRSQNTRCGVCAADVPVGGTCQSTLDCGYLNFICDSGTCKPVSYLGEDCSDSQACSYGLSCQNGICARGSKTEGSSCTEESECAPGLVCDDWNGPGVCASVRVRKAGESCDNFITDYCAYGTQCFLESSSASFVCVAQIPVGQPCDVTGLDCVRDAFCIDGVCTAVAPLECL